MKDKAQMKGFLKRAQQISALFVVTVVPKQYELVPVYIESEEALQRFIQRMGKHLCCEVYNIKLDWSTQLEESRAWHPTEGGRIVC